MPPIDQSQPIREWEAMIANMVVRPQMPRVPGYGRVVVPETQLAIPEVVEQIISDPVISEPVDLLPQRDVWEQLAEEEQESVEDQSLEPSLEPDESEPPVAPNLWLQLADQDDGSWPVPETAEALDTPNLWLQLTDEGAKGDVP